MSPQLKAFLVLLALALAVSAAVFGAQQWQRHRASQSAETIINGRAADQRASDSAYYFNRGQHYEVERQLDSLNHHAETVPVPAIPELPAHPPKQ